MKNTHLIYLAILFSLGSFKGNSKGNFFTEKVYDVTSFGAIGDTLTLNTNSIQQAIDECLGNGGGIVYFPSGAYVSGTIFLKDDIHLYLDAGAILIGSTDVSQFPMQTTSLVCRSPNDHSLIYAENKRNITISGRGVINGQGNKAPYHITPKERGTVVRPKVIKMIGCKNIRIEGITMKNSPSWMQSYMACEDLFIEGITVSNRRSSVNNDGIDIDGCRNVRIANCNIDSEDDAIVLKSTMDRLCENITITGCVISSHCNAIKCGTESSGGFRNISISNCVIYDTYLSGIGLMIVDGGLMDLIQINNITMHRVNNPLFIKLGNRARKYTPDMEEPGIGDVQNIQISNIIANEVGGFREDPPMDFSHENARPKAAAVFIDGLPEKDIQNILLSNFIINYTGGGSRKDATVDVPFNPKGYPEYSYYGDVRPSYGFYCRNINKLTLRDIQVSFDNADYRAAYIFDQVNNLFLENVEGQKMNDNQPVVKLIDCEKTYVRLNPFAMIKEDFVTNQPSELIIQ